ncbi:MAG: hypothetical protein AB8B80_07110 [Marinicellaceae bacterium]
MGDIENHFNHGSFVKLKNDVFPTRIHVQSLIHDIEGFRLIVKPEFCKDAVMYVIAFEDIEQYIVTPNFPFKSLDLFDSGKWGIYKNIDRNTSLLKKYHDETDNMYLSWPIDHYVIIGVNDGTGCVEILSQSNPQITRMPNRVDLKLKL